MLVRELIAELEKQDPDLEVICGVRDGETVREVNTFDRPDPNTDPHAERLQVVLQ